MGVEECPGRERMLLTSAALAAIDIDDRGKALKSYASRARKAGQANDRGPFLEKKVPCAGNPVPR